MNENIAGYDNKIAFLKEVKSRFDKDIKKMYRVDGGKSYIITFNTRKSFDKITSFFMNEEILEKYNISDWIYTHAPATFEIL